MTTAFAMTKDWNATGYDPELLLESLPGALVAFDEHRQFAFANAAAEQLFQSSWTQLAGRPLHHFVRPHGRLVELIEQVRATGTSISEFGLRMHLQRGSSVEIDAHLAPIGDRPGALIISLQPASVARRFDQHRVNRGSTRSASAMARMLAHEVRNPLSGIRGAAQLLDPVLEQEDQMLVRLICDEVDRVCKLIERMEEFGEAMPLDRQPVNIHEILEHVRRLAENGFAKNMVILEQYDPSLPDVDGDRDKLIQLFLNLVKNAAEAAPHEGGSITLRTRYQHGVRIALPSSRDRVELPITIEIRDNGPGVDPDLVDDMFEPFVSSKPAGGGLGLSLVAKIVNDHGGIVSYSAEEDGSVFRVRLAAASRVPVVHDAAAATPDGFDAKMAGASHER
jgi:two-component system nitrogen regulation sensor histidine kinase GlnL